MSTPEEQLMFMDISGKKINQLWDPSLSNYRIITSNRRFIDTTTNLAASAVFTGLERIASPFAQKIGVMVTASHPGLLLIQQRISNVASWRTPISNGLQITPNNTLIFITDLIAERWRVSYENSAFNQTLFELISFEIN